MRLLRVCECVYSPLQIQSKADLLCTSQVSQGEKVCSLVFNEKPKKRSLAYAYQAAHTVPKNKRMLLQANRPRQPNSQAPMHKKRQQLRLWWRDGAKKKKPKKKCQATGAGDGAKKQATCLRMAMRVVVHRSRIAGNSLTQLIQLTHSPGRSLAHSQ